MKKIRYYLSLVKFSHSVFALPFSLVGFTLGINEKSGEFSLGILALVLICMVTARNAAMAFNRYADADLDIHNERTKNREIPKGIIAKRSALSFVIINSLLFVLCSYFINQVCFMLSPIALLIILGYSYTKRFTPLCHFILGVGLGIAPLGAYMAVTGAFSFLPLMLGFAVTLWVSGFDILYALQDEKFDKENGLYSIPSMLGTGKSITVSRILHICTAIMLIVFTYSIAKHNLTSGYIWIGCVVFILALVFQHTLIKKTDFSRIDLAFFTTNGLASLIYGICTIIALFLKD